MRVEINTIKILFSIEKYEDTLTFVLIYFLSLTTRNTVEKSLNVICIEILTSDVVGLCQAHILSLKYSFNLE